jgi:hypothetical protein
MAGMQWTSPRLLHWIGDFNNLLYAMNGGACWRSTVSAPRPYSGAGTADWAACTPMSWAMKTSRSTPKTADLLPSDKAVPQGAVWNGRLFIGRNTTTGPQLWSCNPAATSDPAGCDSTDWSLIATNSVGDTQLSAFNDPGSTSLSMVVATAGWLYVGYDNPGGIVVFRSSAANPTSRADFEGNLGCNAANHPASCEGLGGSAFFGTAVSSTWDALGIGPALYFSAGSSSTPVRVYRIGD